MLFVPTAEPCRPLMRWRGLPRCDKWLFAARGALPSLAGPCEFDLKKEIFRLWLSQ